MKTISFRLLSYFLFALLLASWAGMTYAQTDSVVTTQGPNHISIPNTPYYIVPPDENFAVAGQFSGLINSDADIYIQFADQPKAYIAVEKSILPGLQNEGTVLINRQLIFNGQKARLIKKKVVREPTVEEIDASETKEFYNYQWLLVFGHKTKTTMVTAGYTELFEKLYASDIERALLGVVADDEKAIDPMAVLAFTVSAQGTDLQFATTQLQRSARFTIDGQYPTQAQDRSQFTAIAVPGAVTENYQRQTSIDKVKRGDDEAVTLEQVNQVTIDSLQGYEVIAYSQQAGKPKILRYAILLFDQVEYFVLAGLTDRQYDQRIADFRKISHTFTRKRATN